MGEAFKGVGDQVAERVVRQVEAQSASVQLRHLEQVVDQQGQGADVTLGGLKVALHGLRVFDHSIRQSLHDGPHGSQRGLQVVAHPGDQVAAHVLGFLLAVGGFLELGRHLVEAARQFGDFVTSLDIDARVQIPGGDRAGGPVQCFNAVCQSPGEEEAHRHGDPGGENEQHGRQEQVVLAGEHQAGG